MNVVAVIPARLGSTRFPEKMLAAATGKPLIQHVYENALRCRRLDRITIATDHQRIVNAVRAFGGDVVMTRSDHPNGTSRIAEVAESLDADVIVNVQGDEPEVEPAVIESAIEAMSPTPDRPSHDRTGAAETPRQTHCPVSTVAVPFQHDEDPTNPNVVKVVCDVHGRALYFSRALIPFDRDAVLSTASGTVDRAARSGSSLESRPSLSARYGRPLKHIGLYAYRREFLAEYSRLAPTPLEQIEKLEQLRVLEHGYAIAVAVVEPNWAMTQGIDTPEQYDAFVARICGRSA